MSPSRGILIYSPFIIFAWLCFKYSSKPWRLKRSWLLIGLAWPVLHLVFISRFPHWWAGWSYGARFMTDVLPGLYLLTLYTWPTNFKPKIAKVLSGILIVSCIFSAIVNAGQGLFNKYTTRWNAEPNIDHYPEYLFDWSYPQFLASKGGHESRFVKHGLKNLQPISSGDLINHQSSTIAFLGWRYAEPTHRWSDGELSRIVFKIDAPHQFEGILKLHMSILGGQKITISLNETNIYSGEVVKLTEWDKLLEVPFDKTLLRDGDDTNTLAFVTPDARQLVKSDPRTISLALKSFQIR